MEVSDSYFGLGWVDGKTEQVCQVKKMILVEIKCKQHLEKIILIFWKQTFPFLIYIWVFTSIYFKYINIIFIFWTGKQKIPVILNTDFTLKN